MARTTTQSSRQSGFAWKQFAAYVGSFCVLILLAGLLVGMALGLRPLEARAALLVNNAPAKIEIAWPTSSKAATTETWLPRQHQEEVMTLAYNAMGSTNDGFTRAPLERIGQALADSGWFEGTPKVSRSNNSTIIVRGDWRIPGPVVRYSGKDYLISWDGKLMPPIYEPGEAKAQKVILSPALGPPTAPNGTLDYNAAWPGEDMAASLELLGLLMDKPYIKQVMGIDASEYSGKGRLALVTPEQTRVVWGGRPSKPAIGEVSTPPKLAHLSEIVHDRKRIDAGYPLIYVNDKNLQFDVSASANRQ